MKKKISSRLAVTTLAMVLLGFVPGVWAAQAEHPTNMALLEKAISNAVESLVKGMPVSNLNGPVLMTISGSHEADWMVQNILGRRLREEGVKIVVSPPEPAALTAGSDTVAASGAPYDTSSFGAYRTSPSALEPVPVQLVLSHHITELRMEYPKVWRPHFVGRKMVERHAYASLSARVVDERTGALLWVGESKGSERDAVPASELTFLEGKGEDWQKGAMPPGRLGGLIEPLVVAAIVGGLVYLFYSNKE